MQTWCLTRLIMNKFIVHASYKVIFLVKPGQYKTDCRVLYRAPESTNAWGVRVYWRGISRTSHPIHEYLDQEAGTETLGSLTKEQTLSQTA